MGSLPRTAYVGASPPKTMVPIIARPMVLCLPTSSSDCVDRALPRNPRLQEAGAAGVASIKRGAHDFALQVLPVIHDIQKGGAQTLRAIAEQLTARRIPTRRGGNWDAPQVRVILHRDQRTSACPRLQGPSGGRSIPGPEAQ